MLVFYFKVALTYPNKQPAKNVPMQIKAHGEQQNGVKIQLRKIDNDPNSRDFTDEHGEVEFGDGFAILFEFFMNLPRDRDVL